MATLNVPASAPSAPAPAQSAPPAPTKGGKQLFQDWLTLDQRARDFARCMHPSAGEQQSLADAALRAFQDHKADPSERMPVYLPGTRKLAEWSGSVQVLQVQAWIATIQQGRKFQGRTVSLSLVRRVNSAK